MKLNSFFRYIFCVLALSAASCHGDLDIMQDNRLSASNMWTESSDVISSTYGIYQRMRSCFAANYTNVFFWGELRVGDYMWGPGRALVQNTDMIQVRESSMNASNSSASWSALYTTIDQANSVLKYAPSVDMTDADRSFAIGQAAFARAYCYFWAARLWGDVPLNLLPIESTTQEETYPVRADKALVYAQIGTDIQTALDNADNLGSTKYFATRDAVNLLKAEYALWMYTNQNGGSSYLSMAEEALNAIGISSSGLVTPFTDVFSRTNKVNTEVVFALYNDQSESTGGYVNFFFHPASDIATQYQNNPVPMYSTQWLNYSDEFVEVLKASEADGDTRVAANLGYGNYLTTGGECTWPNKFLGDMSLQPIVLDSDLFYYRYALAVMLDAELKYYQGNYSGALASLNIIAERAYGVANKYTDTSADAVLEAITKEYFLEFPAEGVIWWALIRLDKIWEYNPTLVEKAATNPNILLWPITSTAMNRNNNLTQTEGWS